MFAIDSFALARMQFAANVTFHILFPAINIGMAWILLFFKVRFNSTKQSYWMDAYFFMTKVLAL